MLIRSSEWWSDSLRNEARIDGQNVEVGSIVDEHGVAVVTTISEKMHDEVINNFGLLPS